MYVIHKNIWYPISDFFAEHMAEVIDDFRDSVHWKLNLNLSDAASRKANHFL